MTETKTKPFGDRALRFAIRDPASSSAGRRHGLFRALSRIPGVIDVVLAETIGCAIFADGAERSRAEAALSKVLDDDDEDSGDARDPEQLPSKKAHVIQVAYDGEDLDAVAHAIGRSRTDVIALHAEREYRVAMLGFLPGFAYLRGLDEALRLPRRPPRPRVPAGSVAIAADYTGIYPFASPGGWHLLGRALDFAPFSEDGRAALAIGDGVTFSPSSSTDVAAVAPMSPVTSQAPQGPHLEIVRAAGMVILVDGGRPGRMHEGVPPGGPLVRSMLARANALVGNEPTACAIELSGSLEIVARGGSVVVATDEDDEGLVLEEGRRHVVSTAGRSRVRYLAIAGGGIDAPIVLGSRCALLVANIGRLLRKGDRIGPSHLHRDVVVVDPQRPVRLPDAPASSEIAIIEGPDVVDGLSMDAMTSTDFRIAAQSDRTGTRLDPPPGFTQPLPRSESAPMIVGAIELTPSGLIVFGPDHPTTGGYPVVGVVHSASLDQFFSRPIASLVRFRSHS